MKPCRCGTENDDSAIFCVSCRSPLSTVRNIGEAAVQFQSQTGAFQTNTEDLALFVGDNQTYYLQKWRVSFDPGRNSGWNWVAFFFTPIWFAYRKMYGYATLVFLLQNVMGFFTGGIIGLICAILGGYWGNALYYKHAEKAISLAKMTAPNEELRRMHIQQAGGTSMAGMILTIVIGVVWTLLLSAILINL